MSESQRMLRSRSQVMYSYLPGAVFRHEDRVYGRVINVVGSRVNRLNEQVVFEEIARSLERWKEDDRYNLPIPRDSREREYEILSPEDVRFELWPLVFECSHRECARVKSFTNARNLVGSSRCDECGGRLRQLRFYSAHNCGKTVPMQVPACTTHNRKHIFFEDTGSFRTAVWRCRACSNRVVARTNQSPCGCRFTQEPAFQRMRAHTLDDSRAYNILDVDLVNIDSSSFKTYQAHPLRAQIALAHYLGLIDGIQDGLRQADTSPGSSAKRMTASEWETQERKLRATGLLSEDDIATLRTTSGPAETGLAGLGELPPGVLDKIATERPFLERAAVFDPSELQRTTLVEQLNSARAKGDTLQAASIQSGIDLAERMSFSELSVTWEFPIAKVAFGFTRESVEPGESAARGFRTQTNRSDKYPIFAVASETEALLLTMSAVEVVNFLADDGFVSTRPSTEDEAKRDVLGIFARESSDPLPAARVRTLLHTLSHLLLRGLDDGQVGFAEASLGEWIVPETLSFAIYANSLKSFTLGSLWTLLTNRSHSWLASAAERAVRCENDPLCYQHDPRACERCAYITFGCRSFNHDLDRAVVADYLRRRDVFTALTS
ncbi:hypothetical protein [Kineosporia babensis]|uniref:Uncharacterized protein n=1 Tax=Kineosporia babensis TaxID=499548 RepID=A0A9X1N6P8_9ACTN|nr:hypothetical protein [Kineosporia babensis]MCD5309347.1 hypothetical protein [Kineosporia babensis]